MPNINEHTIASIHQLRAALLSGLKVYHFDVDGGVWLRVISLSENGYVREIFLTPANAQWLSSWTTTHCEGRIREQVTYLLKRGDKLVTKLPLDVIQSLEAHGCLHLMDDQLFL